MLSFKILEIVDLELVAYRLFDADIVPMLVLIQKEKVPSDWKVKVRVVDPTHKDAKGDIDISKAPVHEVTQSLFMQNRVNPHGYLLTKISDEDLPILEQLLSVETTLLDYALSIVNRLQTDGKPQDEDRESSNGALMYGMKLAGDKIKEKGVKGSFRIFKGSDVATYYVDETASEGWVDPKETEGKSIWGHEVHDTAFVIPEITVAITCAKFDPRDMAFNNSAVIFVPSKEHKEFPWDLYLNSAVIRFIHLLSLRTGVLLRRRSHTYPRTLEGLPVPEPVIACMKELNRIAVEIRDISPKIKKRWDIIDQTIANSGKKRLSTFAVDFSTWGGRAIGTMILADIEGEKSLTVIDEEGTRSLLYLHGPLDLLKIIKYLLSENEDEPVEIASSTLQRLEIPTDYARIVKMIDDAENPNSPEITRFKQLTSLADEIIERAFGLSESARTYIHERLEEYPLGAFEPRYPWTAGAHHQKTRVYSPTVRFE